IIRYEKQECSTLSSKIFTCAPAISCHYLGKKGKGFVPALAVRAGRGRMSRLSSAATILLKGAPERAALCRAHPRRALVWHDPAESPAEPAGQPRSRTLFARSEERGARILRQ